MMRKTHGIWRYPVRQSQKLWNVENIYRKTGNIYSISSQISFYHISTPYFFLQYIHWYDGNYLLIFIHISTVYLSIYNHSTSLNVWRKLLGHPHHPATTPHQSLKHWAPQGGRNVERSSRLLLCKSQSIYSYKWVFIGIIRGICNNMINIHLSRFIKIDMIHQCLLP